LWGGHLVVGWASCPPPLYNLNELFFNY